MRKIRGRKDSNPLTMQTGVKKKRTYTYPVITHPLLAMFIRGHLELVPRWSPGGQRLSRPLPRLPPQRICRCHSAGPVDRYP